MAGAQRMGWCWRGGQGQMTEDLGGQGPVLGSCQRDPTCHGQDGFIKVILAAG